MEFPGWDGRVLVTDGGLATELEARGNDLSDPLWSARLLLDAPGEILAAHRAFFAAGADIAITAGYQASFDGFGSRGIGRDEAARLMRLSIHLATLARDEPTTPTPAQTQDTTSTRGPDATSTRGPDAPPAREPDTTTTREPDAPSTRGPDATSTRKPDAPPARGPDTTSARGLDAPPVGGRGGGVVEGRGRWVAASVGPYGAALADGSEYRGRYGKSVAWLRDWHRPRLEVLASAGADLLALETVPDAEEGAALAEAVAGLGMPAWLSYSIAGDRTRAGQPLAEAFAVAAETDEIVAVGVNCCDPADAPGAVRIARAVTGKPVIAYPNSGEGWDANARQWTGPATDPAARAATWLTAGARIIGGCCRVTPAQIHQLTNLREDAPE